FRWVGKEAEVILTPGAGTRVLQLDVETGPSLRDHSRTLRLLDEQGQAVATAELPDKGRVSVRLPVRPDRTVSYRLAADGDAPASKQDPRVLNFRVFRLGVRAEVEQTPPSE